MPYQRTLKHHNGNTAMAEHPSKSGVSTMSKTIGRGFFAFISIVLAAFVSVLAQRFFESMTAPNSPSTPSSDNSGEINSGEINSGEPNDSSTDADQNWNEQEDGKTRIMDEFWDKLNR